MADRFGGLKAQRAALTRAINSGEPAKVRLACARAVTAWEAVGAWPDDWSRWQRALDDHSPLFGGPRLEDLIGDDQ